MNRPLLITVVLLALAPIVVTAQEAARSNDPAVQAILESSPQTPAEQFEAVQLLIQLGQPKLAKPILQQLIDAKLDTEALAVLAEKYGTQSFMQFARNPDLAPESAQFADAVLSSAAKTSGDIQRLSKFVADLSNADTVTRETAVIGLMRGQSASVAPLFAALVDPARVSERDAVHAMLLRLGGHAVGPLIGALESPDAATQAVAVEILGQLEAVRAVTPIMVVAATAPANSQVKQAALMALKTIAGTAPSDAEQKILLERETRDELARARLVDRQDNYGEAAPTTVVWHWDVKRGQIVISNESVAQAARSNAARTARALHQLDPASHSRQQLYLIAILEDAKQRVGLDRPLPIGSGTVTDEAAARGAAAMNSTLTTAMQSGELAAATALAEILGNLGSADVLAAPAASRSPLAEAARHPDRRLRFAAVNAILKISPLDSFAGASSVGESLAYFAGTAATRRALVVHPRASIGDQWAAYLNTIGFDTDVTTRGREAFELATRSPDYELAVIHVAMDCPHADDFLAQLRKDPRTAQLPVAVIAVPDYVESAERLARGVPRVASFAEPQNVEAMQFQVERLLSMPGCAPLSVDERKRQAIESLTWINKLIDTPVAWLDIRSIAPATERALFVPELTKPVIAVLAGAGARSSQRTLLDLINRGSLPASTREFAALEFSRSVAEHGILLTSGEILEQYDHYNEKAGQNAETQKVLAVVLDAIESKSEIGSQKTD
jgi:CheY-like chemotaxis protein